MCVWLDGLATNITEQYLTRHFCRYGHVVKVWCLMFTAKCASLDFNSTSKCLFVFIVFIA